MAAVSAGLLLHRPAPGGWEVLLVHPGGPFFARKDLGAWSIPKGEISADEDPLAAARREFREETSWSAEGDAIPLGSVRQKGGKVVHAWAVRGDADPSTLRSNTFEIEWPPRSGRTRSFPEVDRAAWFELAEARRRILAAQEPLLDALVRALEAEEVLRFWFPEGVGRDADSLARRFEWWFRGGADAEIEERFASTAERAARGELDDWADAPRSRLALILVLDQFSRSLYRDTPRAYAQDIQAQALALEGLERGHYAALVTPFEKTFFLLALGHSEQLQNVETAVALAEQLAREAAPEHRAALEHSASQARGHRDVVARFGRQPHRNAILGRASTPEELDYLARGDLVHLRPIPR